MKIQATLRFKHAEVVELMKKNNLTAKDVAIRSGINQTAIGNFINFKTALKPELRSKLFAFFCSICEDAEWDRFFPKELPEVVPLLGKPLVKTKEVETERLLESHTKHLAIDGPENDIIDGIANKKVLDHLLGELGKREASILVMRYGLGGYNPMTLDEIGKELCLRRERVRQICLRAVEKIQKSRLRNRELLYGVIPDKKPKKEALNG